VAQDRIDRVVRLQEKPDAANADRLHDQLQGRLREPDFTPRACSGASISSFAPRPITWRSNIDRLSEVSGITVVDYLLRARNRAAAADFQATGRVRHGSLGGTPLVERLSEAEADAIFARAARGAPQSGEAERFTAHMLVELARIATEDRLVMQSSRVRPQ
jgi:glucuronate isomerase